MSAVEAGRAIEAPAPAPAAAAELSARAPASPLFDIRVETAAPADLLRQIVAWAQAGEHRRVGYVNAHVLNQSLSNARLRRSLRAADLVYCDGYGARLAARLMGLPVPHRMTGADWIWGVAALCEEAGCSLYLLGSEPGTATAAASTLRQWYPRLDIRGAHHGYFDVDSPHAERVVEDIAERRPDILLVGMGTPQQELWADRWFGGVDAHVVWTVGALFDYLSARVPRAPHWMSDHGLEWIFRLGLEPGRMWRRYLFGNPLFLARVWRARRRSRRSDSD